MKAIDVVTGNLERSGNGGKTVAKKKSEEQLKAIAAILEYTEGYTFSDFEGDAKTRHAVERNFEIIGKSTIMV